MRCDKIPLPEQIQKRTLVQHIVGPCPRISAVQISACRPEAGQTALWQSSSNQDISCHLDS